MNVLILLVFVGIAMVALALILFAWTLRGRTFDHTDRLALLPLSEDGADPAPAPSASATSASNER
ncbi:MAG: cbb3-type cytochrome oxidase assembly protein CcoS [Myxococcota bacterium]